MKKLLTMIGAAAVAVGAYASSINIDSVVQRWPWNNKVDITYTVSGGQDIAREVYARIVFTANINGTDYAIDGGSVGAEASDGQHTVTWNPPSSLNVKSLDCTMTAQLISAEIPSGNDFMIIDLASGEVTYEGGYATITPSTNRYNTATYKTAKMVLRKIPRWNDRNVLPNADSLPAEGYPTGYATSTYTDNVPRNWQTERDYYIGMFEVTQQQYINLGLSNPSVKTGDPLCPVENVSWYDLRRPENDTSNFAPSSSIPAVSSASGNFFQRLNYRTGLYFDLPTEMMCEIASRAGSTDNYYWGPDFDGDYVIYQGNSGSTTWAVGSKLSNDWGIYDTLGNVFEWTRDYGALSITSTSPSSAIKSQVTGGSANRRRLSGGAYNVAETAGSFLFKNRSQYAPSSKAAHIGFRVSLVVE